MKKKTGEPIPVIGKTFVHQFDGLDVRVQIKDARRVFGRWTLLVGVAGQDSNTVWINAPAKPDVTR